MTFVYLSLTVYFPIHVNKIASTVDDQNIFFSKRRRIITCIKGENDLDIGLGSKGVYTADLYVFVECA